ncbi:pyridoxal phosphate-dependent aminotransferase [Bifidobacterium sp. BRDM6]|uniref:alanine transaminase n=2 Tax=Bifidobacterium choloepi TaxID=2614131 RepID=A0A6I5NFU0_9BIFI|nr:pyridoxal phosphate-dependent aminotransferase [Bifidobacterium choloepi]NEG70214.1 pyridoxal phosphate-dependent aminotransferase [Bifidobacterium choloepi]
MKTAGIVLDKLNDSNPTRHGLAPASLPAVYGAEPRGQHAAREALAAHVNGDGRLAPPVDPDRLYLLSSTSEAYAWLMKLLCDAGDAILAPKPGYPLIESIARIECVEPVEYNLRFDGSWTIDIPEIEALVEAGETDGHPVRAIVVINPNNPTGSYAKPAEREAIVDVARRHGLAIIADEVFFDYALEPFTDTAGDVVNRRFAGEDRVLTFALDGFSKTLAAPHAKVGWIETSGPDDDVAEAQRRLDVIADDFLPMGEMIAAAIPGMLQEAPAQTAKVRDRVRGNLATLHAMLAADDLGVVDVLRAEGGWNVLLRFPSVIDENDLVLRMIRDFRTSGQPGYFFDMTSNGYLAISLLPEPGDFRRNVGTVLEAVAAELGQ